MKDRSVFKSRLQSVKLVPAVGTKPVTLHNGLAALGAKGAPSRLLPLPLLGLADGDRLGPGTPLRNRCFNVRRCPLAAALRNASSISSKPRRGCRHCRLQRIKLAQNSSGRRDELLARSCS
jgi:hypothetical protein